MIKKRTEQDEVWHLSFEDFWASNSYLSKKDAEMAHGFILGYVEAISIIYGGGKTLYKPKSK